MAGGHRPGRFPVVTSRLIAGRQPTCLSTRVRRQPRVRGGAGRGARRPVPAGELYARAGRTGNFFTEPPRVLVRRRAVGVIDVPEALENHLQRRLSCRPGCSRRTGRVRPDAHVLCLDPGATTDGLRAELDRLPDSTSFTLQPVRMCRQHPWGRPRGGPRHLVDCCGRATPPWSPSGNPEPARQGRRHRTPTAAGGGFHQRSARGRVLHRVAAPALAGTALGAVLAAAASGLFPTGFVRRINLIGVEVDPPSCCSAAWCSWSPCSCGSAWRCCSHSPAGPSIPARPWRGTPPARRPQPASGSRCGHERSATTAACTLVTLGLLVGGVVAAMTFAVSLDRLVTDPGRFEAIRPSVSKETGSFAR